MLPTCICTSTCTYMYTLYAHVQYIKILCNCLLVDISGHWNLLFLLCFPVFTVCNFLCYAFCYVFCYVSYNVYMYVSKKASHVHVQYAAKKTFRTVPFKRRLNCRTGPCFLPERTIQFKRSQQQNDGGLKTRRRSFHTFTHTVYTCMSTYGG